jgi:hypothetical protein
MARSILTLVFVLLLGSTVQAKLEMANVEAAYGPAGPRRPSNVYYMGDEILIRYTLNGVRANANGEVDVSIALQMTDPDGKVLFAKTVPTKAVIALGGGSVPGTATATLGTGLKPGKYRLGVTATDKLTGETASFQNEVTFAKPIFTSVSQRFYMDPEGKVPAPVGGIVGQTLYYRFGLIGFDRAKGRIETRMDLEIVDDQGKPVLAKPSRTLFKNEDPDAIRRILQVSYSGSMVLNRSGKFGLKFTFTDVAGGQTSHFDVPLRVNDP